MSGSMDGSIDSGLLIPSESAATVQLISSDANLRSEWYALLRAMGYAVIQHAAPQQNGDKSASKRVDLILLLSAGDEAATVELIRQTAQGEQAPPVVVFGAVSGMKWPKRALQAGAFAYLPLDASVEQQAGLLTAAVRFREMQVKVQLLLDESERLCADLVGSYGQASEKLTDTREEAQKAQKALQEVQAKIIKAFT